MTITEQHMAMGSWSLALKPSTDKATRDLLVEYGHIAVTPAPVDPRLVTDATMLSLARYVGVFTERPSSFQLSGFGLAWYLGPEDGVGPIFESAITKTAATMSAWITDLVPAAIATGTLTNGSLGTLTWSCPRFINARQAIDYVCLSVGAEWRVRNNATIDVAAAGTLFNVTPNDVVVRKDGGPDIAINGLKVDLLTEAMDASNYTTKAIVVAKGDGTATAVGTASQATSYNDLRGNDLVVERVVDSPTTDSTTSANTVATNTLNLFSSAKRTISLSTDTYDIGRYVVPGDYLYVWDPVTGLYDSTAVNQLWYRGQLITPTTLRVYSMTWPVQQGMGVYYRDSAGVWTDLTRFVEFEQGSTNFEVGDLVRTRSASLDVGTVSAPAVVRQATNRIGFIVRRAAAQTITSGAQNAITWDTEESDSNGFIAVSSTTATIPTGLDGIYSISFRIQSSANLANGALYLTTVGGEVYGVPWIAGGAYGSLTAVVYLVATHTIDLQVYNGDGASRNFTGRLEVFRIGD